MLLLLRTFAMKCLLAASRNLKNVQQTFASVSFAYKGFVCSEDGSYLNYAISQFAYSGGNAFILYQTSKTISALRNLLASKRPYR